MDFIQKFNELLRARNVTAYRLSVETGIPQSTISSWRQGKSIPSGKYIEKLTKYFGVTADVLIGESARTAASSSELCEEEKELIGYFRALSKSGRRRVLVYAEDQLTVETEKGEGSTIA